jgi:hypothetical protein
MTSAASFSPVRLTIPQPVQPFRAKPFLEALNATVQRFPSLTEEVLAEEGKRVSGGLSQLALGGATVPADLQFRSWVDEWLQSGRTENGGEDSGNRGFLRTGDIPEVVRKYTTSKMSLVAIGNSLKPWLPESAEMETATIQTGKAKATPNPLKTFWTSTDDYAAQLVLFLLSPFRFQLAQCSKCRIYFELPDRHKSYKSGTKCSVCRRGSRIEQAAKITADSRTSAALKLHQLVAKRFQKKITANPEWFKDAALAEEIVLYLNAQIRKDQHLLTIYSTPPRNGITKKWLNWEKNQMGIATQLRTLKRAA